jgi:DNA polymerase I-like protein with 3'-5' exonuclease and polymerase domains
LLPQHIRKPKPDVYLGDNYTVVDFETTSHDYGSAHNSDNRPLMGWWYNGPAHVRPGYHYAEGNRLSYDALCRDIEAAEFFVAHNTKFEYGWLDEMGLDIGATLAYCTRLGEMCIAGNRPWTLSLSACLERRGLGFKDSMGRLVRLGVDTLDIPRRWLSRMCRIDVEKTLELFLLQRQELKEAGLLPTAFTRNILTPVLWDIEKQGMCLDVDRVQVVWAHYANRFAALEAEWVEVTGGVNHNSPKQKQKLLFEDLALLPAKDDMHKPMLTPGGDPSTSEGALKALKCTTKKQKRVVALLQELTTVSQVLSKTLTKLKECVDNEGILTADFIQFSAGTHRLASKGRNYKLQLQNFQRLLRPLVRARRDGWSMGDGDSAGIEFRTAVDLAKDPVGRQDIADGVDVHANTASIVFEGQWDPEANSKSGRNKLLRQDAKECTFKPLYGGQSGTPAQRAYFKSFRERYAATNDMQVGWTEQVLRDKCLTTATGLKFYWPGCKLGGDGKYIKFTTQIFDYPVQSLATGEMCPTATVYLWHLMRAAKMLSFLVNLVHDSAVGEIHPDERDQWAAYMMYCFNELIVWYLKEVYAYEWTTPLESEVNIFQHWDDSAPEEWMAQWA